MSQEKKTDWKDSNWYVSITGFWKEYKKHRMGILGILVLVLFVGTAIAAPLLATHDPTPTTKVAPDFLAPSWMQVFDPEGVLSAEYLPDTKLSNPDLNIRQTYYAGVWSPGTSSTYGVGSGFTSEHYIATDPEETNHVGFTWYHQAGDNPGFILPPPPPNSDLPDVEQFMFFSQTFTWPFNRLPADVNMTIKYIVDLDGDFATYEEGGLMFRLYVWLIDSSGNWRQVFRSSPPYYAAERTRTIGFSYFDRLEAWGGMIRDEDGVQEDPTDELTVAFGIAPTRQFRSFGGYNPYLNYTGSVSVKFTEVNMFLYGQYFGLLGTTDKGGDAWSQLIFGTRVSLFIGVLATALSTAVGVIVGMVSGYFGGKVDEALMRIVDFLLVIPGLPLMMVLAAFLGPDPTNIILVIAVLGWTGTARLIRSQVLAEKNKAYVESARAIGASDTYIIFRHILPNVTPILFANITLGVVGAILSESGLAFLGLTQATYPSWGRMLADARDAGGFSTGAWWVVVSPGLMITALSLGFTFVGHTLDQVLNPRLRER